MKSHNEYDVAVVGGGALGCAMAWESASRGIRTALIEKDDFGAETSANSLGIVHGGLRYLQNFDLARARKSANERAVMLRIAPHLVSPLRCMVPTIRSLKRSRIAFGSGLLLNKLVMAGLNDDLNPDQRLESGGLQSIQQLAEKIPGISLRGVTGAAYWDDGCMLSGERLALAFALSARERGALVLNHTVVECSHVADGKVDELNLKCELTGENSSLRVQNIIDCRGVHVSAGDRLYGSRDADISFLKAVNVVVKDFGLQCAVGAPDRNPDGRIISSRLLFARPDAGATLVGTWYFDHQPGELDLLPAEEQEILRSINGAFPQWNLRADGLLGVQVGFLPRQPLHENEIWPIEKPIVMTAESIGGPKGLWYVQTEKWTTVRLLAERVIDQLSRDTDLSIEPSLSRETMLYGGESAEMTQDQRAAIEKLEATTRSRIQSIFGSKSREIASRLLADPASAREVIDAESVIAAEIEYVVERELAQTPQDVLRRLNFSHRNSTKSDTVDQLDRALKLVKNNAV